MRIRLCIAHALGAALLLGTVASCSDSPTAPMEPGLELHKSGGHGLLVVGGVEGHFSFDFPSPPFPPGITSDVSVSARQLSDGSVQGLIKARRDPLPGEDPAVERRLLQDVTCVHITEDARAAALQSVVVHSPEGGLPLGTLFQTQIVLDEDGDVDQVVSAFFGPPEVTGSNCDEFDISFLLQPATGGAVDIMRR